MGSCLFSTAFWRIVCKQKKLEFLHSKVGFFLQSFDVLIVVVSIVSHNVTNIK